MAAIIGRLKNSEAKVSSKYDSQTNFINNR